jgi:hypothetical protein
MRESKKNSRRLLTRKKAGVGDDQYVPLHTMPKVTFHHSGGQVTIVEAQKGEALLRTRWTTAFRWKTRAAATAFARHACVR